MAESNETLLDFINSSGFLFQSRIEKEIMTIKPGRWQPFAHEHRWIDPIDNKENFIDLILEGEIRRAVIECKRTTDASWVFLIPKGKDQTNELRLLWTYKRDIEQEKSIKKLAEWHDFHTAAATLESQFCIIRGQGEKDAPMLERLSSSLLRSVESVANEELEFDSQLANDIHIYFPIIITNATLYASRFTPDNIDIRTGRISSADFEEIPAVRFRKNLSSSLKPKKNYNLLQTNIENERSILIINSSNLVKALEGIETPYHNNFPWPWERLQ